MNVGRVKFFLFPTDIRDLSLICFFSFRFFSFQISKIRILDTLRAETFMFSRIFGFLYMDMNEILCWLKTDEHAIYFLQFL